MLQEVKRNLKNEKGLALIELFAVVISGIISAIVVPSIDGFIDNPKRKDPVVLTRIQ